jgi:hypothetical protein
MLWKVFFRAVGLFAKRQPTVESRRLGAVGTETGIQERRRRGTKVAGSKRRVPRLRRSVNMRSIPTAPAETASAVG